MKSPKGKEINAVLKSKKLTLDQALEGNSRDKQKVLWTAINSLAKAGDKSASEIVDRDDREHREFQENSVKCHYKRHGRLAWTRHEKKPSNSAEISW